LLIMCDVLFFVIPGGAKFVPLSGGEINAFTGTVADESFVRPRPIFHVGTNPGE
jgi:hypothetical protein